MTTKAEKIYKKMSNGHYSGWHTHEFHTLFSGFGYKVVHGSKHDVYIHPEFREVAELRITLPRHSTELGAIYARKAVGAIALLLKLQKEKGRDNE